MLHAALPVLPDRGGGERGRDDAREALGRAADAEQAYGDALAVDHRLLPSLSARARLLAARGDWIGALSDLETALVARPNDPQLRLRRGELLLRQGDWLRGLGDYEALLEIAGDRYAPDLPRWQGEPLAGRLLIYPEQADIDGDAARRDSLMLARGVDAVLQCPASLEPWLDAPTVRRGDSLDGFIAAAPLRSLPYLLGWALEDLPSPGALKPSADPSSCVGWFACSDPPEGLEIERDAEQITRCRLVVGDDSPPVHLAARLGVPTVLLRGEQPDWLLGPRDGASPWYRTLEVIDAKDSEALAARLER